MLENLFLNPGITIFGFKIYLYAIFIVTGMIVAMYVASCLMKKFGLNTLDKKDKNYDNPLFTYALAILPSGILGCRLYYFLFPHEGEIADWSQFWNFRSGGLGIYGGIIMGAAALIVVALIKKHNIFTVMDSVVPGVMIAQAIGRWGNCVNQEAYGAPVTNPNLQWFPFAVYIEQDVENGAGWYNATFFYESLWNIIGFALMMLIIYRWKFYRKGFFISTYFIWYGIGRFWVESLRSDSLYFLGLKVSQIVAVLSVIVGIVGYAIIFKKEWQKVLFKKRQSVTANGATKDGEQLSIDDYIAESINKDERKSCESTLPKENSDCDKVYGDKASKTEESKSENKDDEQKDVENKRK